MILKLRVNGMFGEAWELIENISSVRHQPINKQQRQKRNIDTDLMLNDYIQRLDKNGKILEDAEYYNHITAWLRNNDKPMNFVTNLVVYLLNDEGKTIERI